MDDRWIKFDSRLSGKRVRMHALWQVAKSRQPEVGQLPKFEARVEAGTTGLIGAGGRFVAGTASSESLRIADV